MGPESAGPAHGEPRLLTFVRRVWLRERVPFARLVSSRSVASSGEARLRFRPELAEFQVPNSFQRRARIPRRRASSETIRLLECAAAPAPFAEWPSTLMSPTGSSPKLAFGVARQAAPLIGPLYLFNLSSACAELAA